MESLDLIGKHFDYVILLSKIDQTNKLVDRQITCYNFLF